MNSYSVLEIVLFLFIDFIIIATIFVGLLFLFLFIKSKNQKKKVSKQINLEEELGSFKNKNLQMETDISIYENLPVAPSTIGSEPNLSIDFINKETENKPVIPTRRHTPSNDSANLFNTQMEQNNQHMNDTFQNSQNTNFFNM